MIIDDKKNTTTPERAERPVNSALSDSPGSVLFVVCHTDVQLDALLQNNGIKRNRVRRLRDSFSARGARSDFPLICLDSFWLGTYRAPELLNYWEALGGKILDVPDDVVLGKAPFLLPSNN